MKKLSILLSLLILSTITFAQGVHFVQGSSWEQLLVKAKAEHKSIFMDCYATWCGPCKEMDRSVYPVDSVGAFINIRFICVKVQMDRTTHDNDTVKSWYEQATALVKKYNLNAYPTLLFFDENGNAVHKVTGFHDAGQLTNAARDAQNPEKQYYNLLEQYKSGRLSYKLIPQLAHEAQRVDEKSLADKVAANYIRNYLDKLDEKAFLTKENTDFMDSFFPDLLTSGSRLFRLCFDRPKIVDNDLHEKDYAENLVNDVIYQEKIVPPMNALWDKGPEPDWAAISSGISREFGKQYVEDNLLKAKIKWYKHCKNGKDYTHFLTIQTEKKFNLNGVTSIVEAVAGYNNAAWDVFQYDTNTVDLQHALTWSNACLKYVGSPDASRMDTKANLLYKLGRRQEAIAVELEAGQLSPDDKDIAASLQKMQAGEPTWPDKMP